MLYYVRGKNTMLIIPRAPKPVSYEIIANYFLNGVLIKSKDKITFIRKHMIGADGSLTPYAIFKLGRSKITQERLDEYKEILYEQVLFDKRKKMDQVVSRFHEKRIGNYTHQIKLTTDAKQSKNRICIYSNTLKKTLI